MLISRGQVIAGRPAVEVRDQLRRLRRVDSFSLLAMPLLLDISPGEAGELLQALLAAGFVKPCGPDDFRGTFLVANSEDPWQAALYTTTIAGNALTKARIGTRMTRADAQRLLDEFLDRVVAANSDETWLDWVDEVLLYGSFARPGDEPVGDIDVAVSLSRRHEYEEHKRRRVEMIKRDGASPKLFTDELYYPSTKLLQHLRGGSRRIDLVQLRDDRSGLPPGAEVVQVYRRS